MQLQEQDVKAFFAAYEERANRAFEAPDQLDVDAAAGAFTDCFIEAHPGGVICFKNDDAFREAYPKTIEMQRAMGARSMKIAAINVTPIDDLHWMAAIRWEARYQPPGKDEVVLDFSETYLVQTIQAAPQIFAYIAGDQDKLLKQHGLLPE
jgi:hypothetical protein